MATRPEVEAWEIVEEIERKCAQSDDAETCLNVIWKELAEYRGVELDRFLRPVKIEKRDESMRDAIESISTGLDKLREVYCG